MDPQREVDSCRLCGSILLDKRRKQNIVREFARIFETVLCVSASSNLFFFETLYGNLPVRSMKKTTLCKRETELPGEISSLIGQKNDFLAN